MGSALAKYLSMEPKFLVSVTFNKTKPRLNNNVKQIKFDCCNAELGSLAKFSKSFDYFINCAIAPTPSLTNQQNFLTQYLNINSLFPRKLSELSKLNCNLKVISISSDAVYDGKKIDEPYNELDVPNPLDLYSISKLLGEDHSSKNFLNIRSSFIGNDLHYQRGILEWVLSRQTGEIVEGYKDYIWSGATTKQFAIFLRYFINENIFQELRGKTSIFNFSCNDALSKYDLIELIIKSSGRKDLVLKSNVFPNGPVNRKLSSVYDNYYSFKENISSLESSIRELISER